MKKKKIIICIILIICIFSISIGGYFFFRPELKKEDGPAVKIDEYEFGDIYQYETDDVIGKE